MNSSVERSLYFMAIVPPQQVLDEINEFKHHIAKEFNVIHALKSPPHITLKKPFKFESNQEYLLTNLLQTFAVKQPVFTIALSGFNCFKPRVVFVEVAPSIELNTLEHDFKRHIELDPMFENEKQLSQNFHPHITLATRDVTPPIFTEIWDQYSNMTYAASFQCDGMSLLKHDGKLWQVHQNFRFSIKQ